MFFYVVFLVIGIYGRIYEGVKPPFYPNKRQEDARKIVIDDGQKFMVEQYEDISCTTYSEIYKCYEVSKCYKRNDMLVKGNKFLKENRIMNFESWLFEDRQRSDSYAIRIDYFNNYSKNCNYTAEYMTSELRDDYDEVTLGACTHLKIGDEDKYIRVYMNCPKDDTQVGIYFQTVYFGCFVLLPLFCWCCCCFCIAYNCQRCAFMCYSCYYACFESEFARRKLKKMLNNSRKEAFRFAFEEEKQKIEEERKLEEEEGSESENSPSEEKEEENGNNADLEDFNIASDMDEEDDYLAKGTKQKEESDEHDTTDFNLPSKTTSIELSNHSLEIFCESDDAESDSVNEDIDPTTPLKKSQEKQDIVEVEVERKMEEHIYQHSKIESEKLMNPNWIHTTSELRDYGKMKEKCCFCFKSVLGMISSVAYILILEFKKLSAVYISFICFLNTDYDQRDAFYPEQKTIVQNYQIFFILAFVVYFVIQLSLLAWWMKGHIVSPIKTTIIYGLYNEWIIFRLLLSFLYVFYIVYGAPAFITTNSRVLANINIEIKQSWDRDSIFMLFSTSVWSGIIIYLKFLLSFSMLIFALLRTYSYDGYSSINYYHRIKNSGFGFPYVKFNLANLTKSPDENLAQVLLMFSLITKVDKEGIKEDIHTYSKSTDFGHLSWQMISGLNWKEIVYLKFKIFSIEETDNIQLKTEEELSDTLKYIPIIKPIYWRAILCFTCCLACRRIRKNRVTDEFEESLATKAGFKGLKTEYREEVDECNSSRKRRKRRKKFVDVLKTVKDQNENLHYRILQLSLGHDKDQVLRNQIDFFVDENDWLRSELIRLKIRNYVEYYKDEGVDLSHGVLLEHGLIHPEMRRSVNQVDNNENKKSESKVEKVEELKMLEDMLEVKKKKEEEKEEIQEEKNKRRNSDEFDIFVIEKGDELDIEEVEPPDI